MTFIFFGGNSTQANTQPAPLPNTAPVTGQGGGQMAPFTMIGAGIVRHPPRIVNGRAILIPARLTAAGTVVKKKGWQKKR